MFGEESSCVRAVAWVVFRSPNITFAPAPVLDVRFFRGMKELEK